LGVKSALGSIQERNEMTLQPVRAAFLDPRLGLAFLFCFVSCLLDSLLMLLPNICDHGLEIKLVGRDSNLSVWHAWTCWLDAWQAGDGSRSSHSLGHVLYHLEDESTERDNGA
jgi:hypothetical protein